MNGEDAVKRLLGVMGKLSQLLRDENEKLGHPGRAKGMKELVTEKQAIGRVYEQHVKTLGAETMKKVTPELRQRFAEAAQSLAQLMDENKRRLEAKMEATKEVFHIIAEAAKEYRAASAGYGNTGAASLDPVQARKAYRPVVSVGVNREL